MDQLWEAEPQRIAQGWIIVRFQLIRLSGWSRSIHHIITLSRQSRRRFSAALVFRDGGAVCISASLFGGGISIDGETSSPLGVLEAGLIMSG